MTSERNAPRSDALVFFGAKDSLAKHRELAPAAFAKRPGHLRYADGDYTRLGEGPTRW